jgi:hypothetical protein
VVGVEGSIAMALRSKVLETSELGEPQHPDRTGRKIEIRIRNPNLN